MPKWFISGLSQYQREFCSLPYTVRFSDNAARQMKQAFVTLHCFYELSKRFQFELLFGRVGVLKDFSNGEFSKLPTTDEAE